MKKGIILTVLLAIVPALSFSQTWTVNNTATWIEAVNGIRSGGNNKTYTITVTGTISVPPTPSDENTFGSVTGVTITIGGGGTLSLISNGSLLVVGAGQTVAARDVTAWGRNANYASMVTISGEGIFRMESTAKVTGNTVSNGGGVYVDSNGTFTKTGATIYGNDAEQNLKNTAADGKGHAIYEAKNGNWRNASVGPTMQPGSYGFWLNEKEDHKGEISGGCCLLSYRETSKPSLLTTTPFIPSLCSLYLCVFV